MLVKEIKEILKGKKYKEIEITFNKNVDFSEETRIDYCKYNKGDSVRGMYIGYKTKNRYKKSRIEISYWADIEIPTDCIENITVL